MILCNCGHQNEKLVRIKEWPDFNCLLGNCEKCGTSIMFIYDNGKIKRKIFKKNLKGESSWKRTA